MYGYLLPKCTVLTRRMRGKEGGRMAKHKEIRPSKSIQSQGTPETTWSDVPIIPSIGTTIIGSWDPTAHVLQIQPPWSHAIGGVARPRRVPILASSLRPNTQMGVWDPTGPCKSGLRLRRRPADPQRCMPQAKGQGPRAQKNNMDSSSWGVEEWRTSSPSRLRLARPWPVTGARPRQSTAKQ